jgi:hypothetical protein
MRHDFRSESHAIEVKTSRSTASTEVMIHGIDQLLAPDGGSLLLFKVTLEPVPDGSVHLAGLYQLLIDVGVPRQLLLDRLASAGCDDPLDPAWNSRAFSLAAVKAWEVAEGFPRLTRKDLTCASLPLGVTRIQYAVDLASADEYLLGEEQIIAWLNEMIA